MCGRAEIERKFHAYPIGVDIQLRHLIKDEPDNESLTSKTIDVLEEVRKAKEDRWLVSEFMGRACATAIECNKPNIFWAICDYARALRELPYAPRYSCDTPALPPAISIIDSHEIAGTYNAVHSYALYARSWPIVSVMFYKGWTNDKQKIKLEIDSMRKVYDRWRFMTMIGCSLMQACVLNNRLEDARWCLDNIPEMKKVICSAQTYVITPGLLALRFLEPQDAAKFMRLFEEYAPGKWRCQYMRKDAKRVLAIGANCDPQICERIMGESFNALCAKKLRQHIWNDNVDGLVKSIEAGMPLTSRRRHILTYALKGIKKPLAVHAIVNNAPLSKEQLNETLACAVYHAVQKWYDHKITQQKEWDQVIEAAIAKGAMPTKSIFKEEPDARKYLYRFRNVTQQIRDSLLRIQAVNELTGAA